ncbi:MAG: polysaccharide biosynthesis/export family protein [Phycisphaeraceae bacterium]|nr:polysaccharide biosynthesis/export family protein [Phycisphaeraceae bacterium]
MPAARGSTPLLLGVLGAGLAGCNVDSFFNPSVVGYWEHQPTTIPILTRLDAIESREDAWGQTTSVSPEDLLPSDLTYRLSPGDLVTVRILDLYATGQWAVAQGRIDPGGFLRVPEVGDVLAAGMTPQELQDALRDLYDPLIRFPQIDLTLEQSGGFKYALYGFIGNPNVYILSEPNFRLLEATALAGGLSDVVQRIFVIRRVALSESVRPGFDRRDAAPGTPPGPAPAVDIDELIERIEQRPGGVQPGALRQDGGPAIDIDDLEPVPATGQPREGIDQVRRRRPTEGGGPGAWVYIEERREWVRVQASGDGTSISDAPGQRAGEPPLYVERIIEIPVTPLLHGDSRYNIIVRPGDQIYVEPPAQGIIYVDGQINRPGSFEIPIRNGVTLSRLIAVAGGLSQLAIPDRIDLVRKVGPTREAVIRVNLAAIRHRTEPDILLKPDDHIIVGTTWAATPLAVIRNGFRATYGFGFLLDRNFGNDVFGAPPTNRLGF